MSDTAAGKQYFNCSAESAGSQICTCVRAGAEPGGAGLLGEGRQDDVAGSGRPGGRAKRRSVAARRASAGGRRRQRALRPGALCAHPGGLREAVRPLRR